MINLYNQVPSVYTNASRDFQYLSWLFNIVLNSVKHNIDDIYNLPNTKADPQLTELLAMTLGFKVKRNYDKKQLIAIVSILPRILKYKGTLKAIELAGIALLRASGEVADFECTVENGCLEVVLPKGLVDTNLFTDLLPYILPAGLTCRVVNKRQREEGIETRLDYHSQLLAKWVPDTDLAGLTIVDTENKPEFTNYKINNADSLVLNSGLLDNSVIPVLNRSIAEPIFEPDYSKKANEHGTTVKYTTTDDDQIGGAD
jgi:hypothetical protein